MGTLYPLGYLVQHNGTGADGIPGLGPSPLPRARGAEQGGHESRGPSEVVTVYDRYDGHMDGDWGVVMVLLMVALIAVLAVGLVWLVRTSRAPTPPPPPSRGGEPGTPEEVLAHRLARGEIDPEDYQARLAALRSAR